jgi:TonB family protein
MSLADARTLGAAIGSDFYILGDAQTLRRSPSSGAIYFESYASIFLVSSRSGRLVLWERPRFEASTPKAAEKNLIDNLVHGEVGSRILLGIRRAREDERTERESAIDHGTPVIEAAPEDDKAAMAQGVRLPRPYRRLQPPYPESAARAEVEAVVDVLVDLDANGEVSHVEVARWAGFGLDQATLATVQQLHFFPALRDGTPMPIRVLLRYNFRKPPK